MAKKPSRLAPEDMPTEREMEGIRQLLMLVGQMQRTLKEQNPEMYAQLMEMQQRKRQA
jgi:hypothetical protein